MHAQVVQFPVFLRGGIHNRRVLISIRIWINNFCIDWGLYWGFITQTWTLLNNI